MGREGCTDLFEVMGRRRSVRSYLPDPVAEGDLNKIIEAACSAPSAGNLQAYRIVVVRDPETRRRLADACWGQRFIAEAPVSLVFLSDPAVSARRYGSRGAELYSLQDATIACAFAMLAAHALGYGTCWVGAFNDGAVLRAVGALGVGLRPVAVLTVGKPRAPPGTTGRRPVEEIVALDTLDRPFPYSASGPRLRRPDM
ncbi:MAG TPA: hypothetical protein ENF83_00245 [Candidatus Korarchaeota archaeon]|nr:hypothetical protein [Candidatus Korarchaeota archaeon]